MQTDDKKIQERIQAFQKDTDFAPLECETIKDVLILFESYIDHIYFVNKSLNKAKRMYIGNIISSILNGIAVIMSAICWIMGIIIYDNIMIGVGLPSCFITTIVLAKSIDAAIDYHNACKIWNSMLDKYSDIAIVRIRTAKLRRLQNYEI